MTKNEVIKEICDNKIIAILRNIEQEKLINLAEALYEGGIRLLEITFCADGRVDDAVIAKNIRLLAEHFNGKMCIGAGTVLTAEQVRLAHNSGALYVISPNVDKAVAAETHLCNMAYIPGALTPTEVQYAHLLGADFVKLFPVSNLGPEYVKAVKAPLSHIKLLAVGGINPGNMAEYIKAGVCGFGIGASIAPKELLGKNNFGAIKTLAERYVSEVQ